MEPTSPSSNFGAINLMGARHRAPLPKPPKVFASTESTKSKLSNDGYKSLRSHRLSYLMNVDVQGEIISQNLKMSILSIVLLILRVRNF